MDAKDFETELRQAGFNEVVIRDLPPGYFLGDHAHDFDSRALITAGEITLTVDGTSRTYPAGSIFELNAGCAHQERAGVDGVSYLVGRRAK